MDELRQVKTYGYRPPTPKAKKMSKSFRKVITILEIPLYLLILGTISLDEGHTIISIFLLMMSVIRLWLNTITYKDN